MMGQTAYNEDEHSETMEHRITHTCSPNTVHSAHVALVGRFYLCVSEEMKPMKFLVIQINLWG